MNLNDLAREAHEDATRRGIYPQGAVSSLKDLAGEVVELTDAQTAFHFYPAGTTPGRGGEAADVLLTLLSYCQEEGIDIDAAVQRKMEFNKTRGPRN